MKKLFALGVGLALWLALVGSGMCAGTSGGNVAPLGPGALHGMPYHPYQDEFYSQEREDDLQAQKWFWQQWNLRYLQQQRNRYKQKSPRY